MRKLVIINAKLFDSDKNALLIEDGIIKKIAYAYEFKKIKDKIDLKNKLLIPGFIDSHVHICETGLQLEEINLMKASSIEEILSLLEKENKKIIIACNLKPHKLKEKRYPTLKELDRLKMPVFIKREDLHSGCVNTEMAKVLKTKKGILRGKDFELAIRKIRKMVPESQIMEAIIKVDELSIKNGITTICGFFSNFREYEIFIKIKNKLKIDIIPFIQTKNVKKVKEYGLNKIGGCLLIDGSISSGTAAMFEDYRDEPGNKGILYFSDNELLKFIKKAKDLQIAMHAIGDRAVHQLANAYSKIIGNRNRIEHAELITEDTLNIIKQNNIIISAQPKFVHQFHNIYLQRLGKKRTYKMNNFRKIIDYGITLIFGSDSPITKLSAIDGIKSAINHKNKFANITLKEAIDCYTKNPAYANFMENKVGHIKEGYTADLIALNDDLSIYSVIKKGEIIKN